MRQKYGITSTVLGTPTSRQVKPVFAGKNERSAAEAANPWYVKCETGPLSVPPLPSLIYA
jgi:hypothetical protein